MARGRATKIESKFIRGLVTEATALSFPKDGCIDCLNVEFDSLGTASRRKGIDLEDNYQMTSLATTSFNTNSVTSEYVWRSAGSSGDTTFVVQQVGRLLMFFDISNSNDVSPNVRPETFDLTARKITDAEGEPSEVPCQYTTINGDLICVNKYTDPFFIRYDPSLDELSIGLISVHIRDFYGLEDELEDDERITSTLANLITNQPGHYYNILNQGWAHLSGAVLTAWDTARGDIPSNRDVWYHYRQSGTVVFDNARVTANSFGSRESPKGHFLIHAFSPDRAAAVVNAGLTTFSYGSSQALNTDYSAGFGNFANPARSFDGVTNANTSNCSSVAAGSSVGYNGKTFNSPLIMQKIRITGSNNKGYCDQTAAAQDTVTIQMWGKTGATPATSTDGTLIGTISFTDTTNESSFRTIESTDLVNSWDHVWIRIASSAGTAHNGFFVSEILFYEYIPGDNTLDFIYERPTCVANFAGRVWYADVKRQGVNNEIFFSRIAEIARDYGKCFQRNDPTNEVRADLLPDDGGTLRILAMGQPKKMLPVYNNLIIWATNGVWAISGSQGQYFEADDYSVKQISDIGTDSSESFVMADGIPYWWGSDGIYALVYNPEFNAIEVRSLTEDTIKEFYKEIGQVKTKVKGAYDSYNKRIVWIYDSNNYEYTKALAFNLKTKSFSPWTLDSSTRANVAGIVSIYDSNRLVPQEIKFTVIANRNDVLNYLSFADMSADVYADWTEFSLFDGTLIDVSALTKIGDVSTDSARLYDGTKAGVMASTSATKASAANAYAGVTLSTAQKITRGSIYPSDDEGFLASSTGDVKICLYGKTGAAPASGTDGTLLGERTITDTTGSWTPGDPIIVTSSDISTDYDHVWFYLLPLSGTPTIAVNEVEFFGSTTSAAARKDYDSFMISGYNIDADANKDFQTNYVTTFMNTKTNSSCLMQSIFDFSNNESSKRWSTAQQMYSDTRATNSDVCISRLKLRGRGKSVKFKFQSVDDKPFEVLGWAAFETGNQDV